MADADNLLMETSEQNGNEGEEEQNGAELEQMAGDEEQDNNTDGGKIDASKGEEDAGWVSGWTVVGHMWCVRGSRDGMMSPGKINCETL